jgi:hypothetical protein
MAYVLTSQRSRNVGEAFRAYHAYLEQNADRFPKSAYELATSSWYFDASDHRCPHDAWLESATFTESGTSPRQERRFNDLSVRLLGAYHDGYIDLTYPEVRSYSFDMSRSAHGHGDWRYDEFRAAEDGGVVHEIEWAAAESNGRWVIESRDVLYKWTPHVA